MTKTASIKGIAGIKCRTRPSRRMRPPIKIKAIKAINLNSKETEARFVMPKYVAENKKITKNKFGKK